MSETKAAFNERTIRSVKKLLYRYMEGNGYKNIQKLTLLVTSPKSGNDRLHSNDCKEFRFPVHSVQQTTTRI